MKKIMLLCLILCNIQVMAQTKPTINCLPEPFDKVAGVTLYEWSESKSFYFFESKMAIDADGSPRAYHPQDKGLDKLEYAGRQGNWWALVTDNKETSGNPLVQKQNDPYPGYYISMTATVYRGYPDESPQRYIDAEKIPYFVLNPQVMRSTNTQKGDIGYVYNRQTKKGCYAIFGDVGRNNKLGEGSIYLAEKLGIKADPRAGGQDDGVVYMVFPFSGNGAARSLAEINSIGEKIMNKADAFSFIKACLEGKDVQRVQMDGSIIQEVNGSMVENRQAFLSRETSKQPYFATHPTLPANSIILVKNMDNQKEVVVQIIGKTNNFRLSRTVFEKLYEGNDNSFEVELVYNK